MSLSLWAWGADFCFCICIYISISKRTEFRLKFDHIPDVKPYITSLQTNIRTLNGPHARSTPSTHLNGSHIRTIGVYIPEKGENKLNVNVGGVYIYMNLNM